MAKPRETNQSMFLSAAFFLIALDAVEIYASQESEFDPSELVNSARRHLAVSMTDFSNGLSWFSDIADQVGLSQILKQTQEASSPTTFRGKARILREKLFPRLQMRTSDLMAIFPAPVIQAARIMLSCNELLLSDPIMAVKQAASAKMPGKPSLSRVWVKEASEIMGAPLSRFEQRVEEVVQAQDLGDQVRQLEIEMASAPPTRISELARQKGKVIEKIDNLANESTDPEAVLSTAATSAAPKPEHPGSKSPIAQRLGLSPDQEEAMLAEGKVLIAAGAGSGKCIRGDSLIQTEKGFVEIQSLCNLDPDQDFPLQMWIHGKDGPEQTSHIYRNGVSPTRKIETRNGYFLEGTPNHRILAFREEEISWIFLSDLQEGDFVVIDRRPGLFAEIPYSRIKKIDEKDHLPIELTLEVATLLGYIVSEGYVRKDTFEISMGSSDPEQILFLKKSLSDLNIEYTQTEDQRQITPNRKPWTCFSFFKTSEIKALMEFGITKKSAHEKEIPFGILISPKIIVRNFLRSLFDGDGGVEENCISYCTSSEKLASQLQILLLSFGIISKKKFRSNEKKGAYYLYISGLAAKTFAQEIGFNLSSKTQKLNIICSKESNTNIDTIPGVGFLCRKVKQSYKNRTGTTHSTHPSYGVFKDYTNSRRSPSFEKLQEFLQTYNSGCSDWEKLNEIAHSRWFFDPIYHIEDSEADTFDFVVPGTHSFSGNGFINHNTRVLAAMVVDIIERRGVKSNQVIATSFSRKSAAELKERVISYGGSAILDSGDPGFGTTHSVAGKIMRDFAPAFSRRPSLDDPKGRGITQNGLLKMAIKQVSLLPNQNIVEPTPKGFFDGLFDSMGSQRVAVPGMELEKEENEIQENFLKALRGFEGLAKWALDTYGRNQTTRWADDTLRVCDRLKKIGIKSLTPADVVDFRRVAQRPAAKKVLIRLGIPNFDVPDAKIGKTAATPTKKNKSKFWEEPANQYFNLGIKKLEDRGGRPMGVKRVSTALSLLKGNLKSATEAWSEAKQSGDIEAESIAAVYGAYEWLKANDATLGQPVDFDDLLIEACKILIGNKQAREALQTKFKYILVDEAQDQNMTQDLLFGLIAGYINPETRKPYGDGRMTAKAFIYIGDDKQSIYEFRGAKPDLFIEKSNLVGDGQGEFQTHLLKTNYRSGQAIVDAANKLIAHNEKQVPMVCDANTEKNGMGVINTVSVLNHESGAHFTADRIEAMSAEIGLLGSDKKPNFGVAVRTNAEANAFAMDLLRRKIPFRSKVDLFGGLPVKSLLMWSELASNPPTDRLNEIVLNAFKMPKFGLDEMFVTQTQAMASKIGRRYKNYLEMLFDNYEGIYLEQEWRNKKKVLPYLNAIADMREQSGSTFEIMERVLDLYGDKESFIESLIKDVREDPEMMDLLFEENNRAPSEEEIKALALAPVKVFLDLAKDPQFQDIGPFMNYMKELQDLAKSRYKKDDPSAPDFADPAVVIDTVHGWKGLECHHLFVPMEQGVFPHAKSVEEAMVEDNPTKLASERRLAYVAITRGQESVTVLSPQLSSKTGKPIGQSLFIEEACISPMGIDQTTMKLDEDRIDKTAFLETYDESMFDDFDLNQDYVPSDILNDVWGIP